ncbi:MAG TPA: helix-turn-helix transcriptional regulator [Streptosporangiaceae bacterium]
MLEQPAFGHRLRALRLERGLSQAALAADGLSPGYLSRLESGARPPTGRIVRYLAERLDVPVSAFDTAQSHPSLAQVLASVTAAVTAATDDARTDDSRTGDARAGDARAGDFADELAETLTEALRAGDQGNPALRWQALWLLARIRDGQGRHDEELALLTDLAALGDEQGAPELRARARTQLARCLQLLGDNTRAREYAAEAWALSAGLPAADRAAALQALVSAEAESGRLAEARAHADELCELTAPAAGPPHIKALWAAATVRIRQADHRGAREVLERALAELDSHEDLMLWMRLRLAAASLYLQITPPLTERAAARLDEVDPLLDLVGTDLHKQQMMTLRAHLAFEEGRVDDARELCERMAEQPLRLSFRDRVRFEALRGELLILDGRLAEGTRVLQELAEQAQGAQHVELAAEIWRNLAKTLAGTYGQGDADGRPATGTSGTAGSVGR